MANSKTTQNGQGRSFGNTPEFKTVISDEYGKVEGLAAAAGRAEADAAIRWKERREFIEAEQVRRVSERLETIRAQIVEDPATLEVQKGAAADQSPETENEDDGVRSFPCSKTISRQFMTMILVLTALLGIVFLWLFTLWSMGSLHSLVLLWIGSLTVIFAPQLHCLGSMDGIAPRQRAE